jgi:hypothetical protein
VPSDATRGDRVDLQTRSRRLGEQPPSELGWRQVHHPWQAQRLVALAGRLLDIAVAGIPRPEEIRFAIGAPLAADQQLGRPPQCRTVVPDPRARLAGERRDLVVVPSEIGQSQPAARVDEAHVGLEIGLEHGDSELVDVCHHDRHRPVRGDHRNCREGCGASDHDRPAPVPHSFEDIGATH